MYLGDFAPASMLDFDFNTFNQATGPATLAGTPALAVYKSNGTTESTAGITLSVDFDGRTGLNHVRIDTSADGAFYATGNDFVVAITAGTVSGISVVGLVVGEFSLHNRAALRPTTAGRTLDVDASGGAEVGSFQAGAITNAAFAAGAIDSAAIATDAIDADALATDAVNELADGILDRAAGVETGYTLRQAMRLMLAVLAGKLSGSTTTTIHIRDMADSKDRIVSTVDVHGNRNAVTRDAS